MQLETGVGKRYATALFYLGLETGKLESIEDQVQDLIDIFKPKPEITKYLCSPMVDRGKKFQLLEKLLGGVGEPELVSFLKLMVRKGRAHNILSALELYNELVDHYRGIEDVTVITAIPLDDAHYQMVFDAIARFSPDRTLRTFKRVDASLIGGAIIQLGKEKVIDGSLQYRMKRLKENLLALR